MDAVANDRHHVAILDHLVFIGDVAVAGNDDRAAFALMLVDRAGRMSLSALISPWTRAAVVDVDERVLRRREHVAGNDDVGATEVDEAVAVGDGVVLPEQFNRVAVVERPSPFLEVGIAWDRRGRLLGATIRFCTF